MAFLLVTAVVASWVVGGPVPNAGAVNEVPTLQVVRIGNDGTFDRVVFEFSGDVAPAATLIGKGPNDGTLAFDPSGLPVTISGAQLITVRMESAIATYAASNPPGPLYAGPTSITPTGTANIVQVMQIGDFESVLQWTIGMRTATAVTVQVLTNPVRVVVDVPHAAAPPAQPVPQTPVLTG
ncbi:MAG TPA: hypothetical protein VIJ47_04715 [Acidimicrobiales bacterium]